MEKLAVRTSLKQSAIGVIKTLCNECSGNDLIEIKKFIGSYFAKKAIKKADAHWDGNSLSDDVMDKWLESNE